MAKRQRPMEAGGSSSTAGGRTVAKRDPYYSPNLQAARLAKFRGRRLTYIRYASSYGSPLGDCENEQWESFNVVEMHKSCMHGPHYFVLGELTKVGSLTVENRLLHYLIAHILVQRNTKHAQSIVNNMVIDHLEIDTFEVDFTLINTHEHLVGEHLIHKMSIYWYNGQWMYQEDYRTTVDIELSNEEHNADLHENNPGPPQPKASQAPLNVNMFIDLAPDLDTVSRKTPTSQKEERKKTYKDYRRQRFKI
ncbi:hypothetical protein Lal_00039718 [Lupinus albus]|nr:hypothetical protein Lal_00039718 [Lupinus albus]